MYVCAHISLIVFMLGFLPVVGTQTGPTPPGASVRQKVPPPPGEDGREVSNLETLKTTTLIVYTNYKLLVFELFASC